VPGYSSDLWFSENLLNSAGVSGESASAILGVDNLKDNRIGKKWRPAASGTVLTVSLSPARKIDVIGIFGIVGGTGLSVNVQLTNIIPATDSRSGSFTPTVDPYAKQALWLPDAPASPLPLIQSLTMTFTYSGTLDIGKIWIGEAFWMPSVGHDYGSERGMVDMGSVLLAQRTGAVFADSAAKLRTFGASYSAITPAEANGAARGLLLRAGTTLQTLFIPDPSVYDTNINSMLGYIIETNPIIAAGFDRYQRVLNIKESG